jgi:hypothetical protein
MTLNGLASVPLFFFSFDQPRAMVEMANVNERLKRSQAMDRTLANPVSENERRTGDRIARVHPYPLGPSAPEHGKKHILMPGVTKLVNSVRRLKKAKDDEKLGRVPVASDDDLCYLDGDDDDDHNDEDEKRSLDSKCQYQTTWKGQCDLNLSYPQ